MTTGSRTSSRCSSAASPVGGCSCCRRNPVPAALARRTSARTTRRRGTPCRTARRTTSANHQRPRTTRTGRALLAALSHDVWLTALLSNSKTWCVCWQAFSSIPFLSFSARQHRSGASAQARA